MGKNSKIEWCDHTWNPWVGCTKISPACDNCYAENWSKRSGRDVWGPHADRQRTKTWKDPIKWNKALEGTGKRERVFVASLADVFDNHKSILPEWRDDMWQLIKSCPNLDFLLLTKRPHNIKKFLPDDWGDGYPNVWLGTTVENQEQAKKRIPRLLTVPAKIRFLSCEPLLEEINLELRSKWVRSGTVYYEWDALSGVMYDYAGGKINASKIDWVICGGESGHKARPLHPEWVRNLAYQCKKQTCPIPFFFKQWGEWLPGHINEPPFIEWMGDGPIGNVFQLPKDWKSHVKWADGNDIDKFYLGYKLSAEHTLFYKAGVKQSGRRLDGCVFNQFPESKAKDHD